MYGFQGQERDDELKGAGNSITFEYRIHDTRLGRFLSVDPLEGTYPWNSPYAFSENRVYDGIELEGLEWKAVSNDDGDYVGYQWDPDNARNANGDLKSGYYETAILFSERGEAPKSGSADANSGFHAIATVYKSDGTEEEYDATTLPSDSKLFGTVEAGLYKAQKGTHPMSGGYAALNMYTLAGSRDLPAQGGNNPRNGRSVVSGVNIHRAGKNDYLGTYTKADGTKGGISEGCMTLKAGKDKATYNDFINQFKSGQDIGVVILRSKKQEIPLDSKNSIEIVRIYGEPDATSVYVRPIVPIFQPGPSRSQLGGANVQVQPQ